VSAWIGLVLIGGAGAVARFRLDAEISRRGAGEFPLGTLVINVGGAFALGVLTGAGVTGDRLFLAGTGFIGSFTTFSTWMFETERLAEDGEENVALANLVVSVLGGLAAAGVGWALGALS
jgi:fluoride exporter